MARFHIHTIVPWLGGLLAGSQEYRYLQQSIAAFPAPHEFCMLMKEAGLLVVEVKSLTFGAAHLFVGQVQEER
jgi:demethylmenaquinone methyltransferase/2-methoxy-6-polyprenyl-1,4-benzoquinol methylase